jgi:hypothetical protein
MKDCSPSDSGNWKSEIFSVTEGGYRPIAEQAQTNPESEFGIQGPSNYA